jgi:type IX secretion system PorP/SprF family membrane protein
MMRTFTKIFSAGMFFCGILSAQDHQLSNYDLAGLYLNPALTGMLQNEEQRITADQRSQWRSLGIKPFMSSYLAYDRPCVIQRKNVGLGAYLINNRAGLAGFNTFAFMLSASYDIMNMSASKPRPRPKDESGLTMVSAPGQGRQKHSLRLGLQMGLLYRSSNSGDLLYDSQYSYPLDGGSFDRNLPSNEYSTRVNIARFDAAYGIWYQYLEADKKVLPYAGFSMRHLTRPNESLTGDEKRLPVNFKYSGGFLVKVNQRTGITPRFLYLTQAKAYAFSGGVLLSHTIENDDLTLKAGFDYRLKDALIFSFGVSRGDYALRFAYDHNISYLRNYTNGRGAFEAGIVYAKKKR